MNLERTGGCLCGAVRFTATLTGTSFGVCHCTACRKWTGSALLGITVPEVNLAWTGLDQIARRGSSTRGERAWCGDCGSPLWFRIIGTATLELPVGTLDDASGLTMTNENFFDSKPDSFSFGGVGRRVKAGSDCLENSSLSVGG